MSYRRSGQAAGLVGLCVLSGCGNQSTVRPASHASRDISSLWWWMLAGSAIVFAVVLALVVLGLLRRQALDRSERRPIGGGTLLVAAGGVVAPVIVIVVLFAATLGTLPTTSAAGKATSLTVDVIGREWFWDVQYPGKGIRTANEIHIPVGASVLVRVTSDDVIHSLWVPELNRKIDAIPGQTNVVVWHADRAGMFRGQCAEYCGVEHAHMGLWVIAQPRAAFEQWLAQQAQAPPQPATPEIERGQQVFLGSACEYCHTIAGTNASGTVGPDLSHLADRLSIGAATIPNTKAYLAGWILDPQHVKPGNKMPGTALSGRDFQALLAYLETLR